MPLTPGALRSLEAITVLPDAPTHPAALTPPAHPPPPAPHTHTHTWWQDCVECVDAEHAQVADGECAAVVLIRGQLLAASTLHQVGPVAGQLVDVNLQDSSNIHHTYACCRRHFSAHCLSTSTARGPSASVCPLPAATVVPCVAASYYAYMVLYICSVMLQWHVVLQGGCTVIAGELQPAEQCCSPCQPP